PALPVVIDVRTIVNVIRDDLLLRIRIGVVTNETVIEIRVCALHEADVRAVVLRESLAVELPTPVASGDVIVRGITKTVAGAITRLAIVWIEEEVARGCSECLKAHGRLLIETKATVESYHLVMFVDEVVTRGDHAERVFLADVAFESQHTDVSVLIEETFVLTIDARIESATFDTAIQRAAIVGAQVPWSIVARDHQSERVATFLTRSLHRHIGIDDRACMNRGDRRLKDIDAFEEERTLLRKEDRKTLVCCYDELIRFHLREIRIDREVDCYPRAGDELRCQSEIESDRLIHHAALIVYTWGPTKRRHEAAVLRNRRTRNQLDRALDGDSFETCQMARLAQVAVDAARHWHPRIELVLETLDATEEMRAPEFSFAGFEAQRLERDRDLNVEARLMTDALRIHQEIDAEIFATSLGDDAVALNTEWIEKDLEGFALVVERVEHEADVVVIEDVVAFGHGRANLVGLVNGFESDVEELRIEADQDFRRFRRWCVVAGLNLVEVFQHCGFLPDFFVELAVDRGRFFKLRNRDGL